jgi:hypothetical protein
VSLYIILSFFLILEYFFQTFTCNSFVLYIDCCALSFVIRNFFKFSFSFAVLTNRLDHTTTKVRMFVTSKKKYISHKTLRIFVTSEFQENQLSQPEVVVWRESSYAEIQQSRRNLLWVLLTMYVCVKTNRY